jgi:hypothetical protein
MWERIGRAPLTSFAIFTSPCVLLRTEGWALSSELKKLVGGIRFGDTAAPTGSRKFSSTIC